MKFKDYRYSDLCNRLCGLAGALLLALLVLTLMPAAAAEAAEGASGTDSDSGVSITITTDKTEYRAGEAINYTFTLVNDMTHWYTAKADFTYTLTDGLEPVSSDSMPTQIAKAKGGETVTVSGSLIGNAEIFPDTGETADTAGDGAADGLAADAGSGMDSSAAPNGTDAEGDASESSGFSTWMIICAVAILALVIVILILILRKKGSGKGGAGKALALFLAFALAAQSLPLYSAEAAGDYETIKLRPYVKVLYAGQEVTIRAVFELHAYPEKVNISSSDKNVPSSITCHDPSIFKDFDGTYYLFGTHIAAGMSDDLRNWTSYETAFRASFSKETIASIREWNKDDGSSWYGYLWAPDVVYNPVMGKYCYYLSADGDDWKSNIVLLTSDSVMGPYEYAGSVVYGGFSADDYTETDLCLVTGSDELPERYVTNGVKNKKWGDKWPNCIDPCVFYDDEGNLWMSYGSWSGGIFMLQLDEETGLRDYSVSYDTNEHSDAYFGKKIAGGCYVSGEGSYIQKIGDYYWLFISYGALEAAGGYNIRVFRSTEPDGEYVDMQGNSPLYDSYVLNINQSVGVRLFGGYKWRTFSVGQVAQGHNSAFVDDDGKAYIVYHSRTTDGTEGHSVKVHQLFLNEDGWLVAAPYITDGETLADSVSPSDVTGEYEIILHELGLDYKNLDVNMVKFINLNADGTVTGEYEGSWELAEDSSYINISINGDTYKGVVLSMNVENTKLETEVFTAVGEKTQITLWGSRVLE